MDKGRVFNLQPEEREAAHRIWLDLKRGAADAHERLNAAPEHIRTAILEALVIAMNTRNTAHNPFG